MSGPGLTVHLCTITRHATPQHEGNRNNNASHLHLHRLLQRHLELIEVELHTQQGCRLCLGEALPETPQTLRHDNQGDLMRTNASELRGAGIAFVNKWILKPYGSMSIVTKPTNTNPYAGK